MTRLSWCLIRDPLLPGARNMALDHALALCLEEGTAVLRLYGWSRQTISFGRNEPSNASYDRRIAAHRGLDFVRRPTGGRAVLHDQELTYAVVVPLRALGGPRAAYHAVNSCLARALVGLGIDARVTTAGRVLRPDGGPCFGAAAPGEVVVEGRKRIGSAQARIGHALLQHGSILLGTDQEELQGVLVARENGDVREPPSGREALASVSGHVERGARSEAVAAPGRPDEPTPARPDEPTPARPDAPTARPDEPAAARPNQPAAARPNQPAATRPDQPAAARPNEPAATRPDGPVAAWPDEPTPACPDPGHATAAPAGAPPGRTPAALDAMSIDEVACAVAMSLMRTFGGTWHRRGYDARETAEADRLETSVYGRESWTWRR